MANQARGQPQAVPRQEHPLIEPRMVAAFGVVALGTGAGWALMFAHVLLLLGLGLSVASAIGVISIYAKHLRPAHAALMQRKKYDGPGLTELLVAMAVLTIVVVVSPIIYANVRGSEIILSRAEIQLNGIIPVKQSGFSNSLINVQWTNHGTLTLTNGKMDIKAIFWNSTQPMPKQQVDPELKKTRKAVDTLIAQKKSNVADALFGQGFIVTISDFVISDADWAAVQQGLASIYIFYSVAYTDDAVLNKGFWRGDFCAYFTQNQNFYHNCAANHLGLE